MPGILFAGNVTLDALGEYVMGDNDTYTDAKKLALQDAKRVLLEKVGTYIESKTEVKNGVVSSDEIKQYTAGIVKVEEIGEERSILANKASVVKVNIKAVVDPDSLLKQVISFRNRKDIEESAKKLSTDNDKLRKEIDQLNNQLRNVVNENKYRQLNSQRKEILGKIDANERGLTLLLSGKALHAAALLDRRSKDNAKEKVKTFMKEIASAYKLTASTPAINNNGDGTANVSFEVEVLIPIDSHTAYKPSPRSGYVKSITGVNLADLVSTGLNTQYTSGGKLYISCEKGEKCRETEKFIATGIASLVLSVSLGTFEKKENLSDDHYRFKSAIFRYHFKKKYNIKMPLAEVKSLSSLKLEVLYNHHEYGQAKEKN